MHLAESGTLPFELYGETPVHAWISYDAEAKELSVYAAPSGAEQADRAPLFTYKVNLAELLHSNTPSPASRRARAAATPSRKSSTGSSAANTPPKTVSRPTVDKHHAVGRPLRAGHPRDDQGHRLPSRGHGRITAAPNRAKWSWSPKPKSRPRRLRVSMCPPKWWCAMRAAPPRVVLSSLRQFATPDGGKHHAVLGPTRGGTPVTIKGTGFLRARPWKSRSAGSEPTSSSSRKRKSPPRRRRLRRLRRSGRDRPRRDSSSAGPSYTFEAPLRSRPGDRRTAQSPDGHRTDRRELQSHRLDARALRSPERAVVLEGARGLELHPDPRRRI